MRVFLGTAEIAGYYARLADGFAEIGVDAVVVPLVSHPLRYEGVAPRSPLLRLVARTADRRRAAVRRRRSARMAWRLLQEPLRPALLLWAVVRCDTFVLSFGTSIAGPWELPLLRLLGKRVVHVFHGSDTRPPYLDGFLAQRGSGPRRMRRLTRRHSRRLRWIERWTHAVVCHTASAQLHRRPFVAFLHMGIAVVGTSTTRAGATDRGGPVRLLHSPSNPGVKGSELIRRAVAEVAARGVAVEFVEITGRPNAEVRQAILDSDLVVDQAYSDQPLASFVAEAAVEGVPAIVAGYAAGDAGALLPQPALPSAYVLPELLVDELERLVRDADARQELGRRAQQLTQEAWTPASVAARFVRLFDGDVPADWLVDPREVTYPLGCGLDREQAGRIVAALVGRYGPSALCVDDKPALLARLLELAQGGERRDLAAARR